MNFLLYVLAGFLFGVQIVLYLKSRKRQKHKEDIQILEMTHRHLREMIDLHTLYRPSDPMPSLHLEKRITEYLSKSEGMKLIKDFWYEPTSDYKGYSFTLFARYGLETKITIYPLGFNSISSGGTLSL
jgi:hypothetical protein